MRQVSSTVPSRGSADQRRVAHSDGPRSRKVSAVSQKWRGGFSRYGSPFAWGITQSPSRAISSAIVA
jgi:hypothetical protein